MKKHTITEGTRVDTLAGYYIFTGHNDGGLFYADEYTIDDDGNAAPDGKAMLTAADIERHMKEVDGENHKVTWTSLNMGEEAMRICMDGLYDAAVELMDDELREEIHAEYAPCTNIEFLARYMQAHREKYGTEFVVN